MEKSASVNRHESINCSKANHLNKIVTRSLSIELDRIQKDHIHRYKNRLAEKKIIENELVNIINSTEKISDKIFEGSRFNNLMQPVHHVSLSSIIAEHSLRFNQKSPSSDVDDSDLDEEQPHSQLFLPPIESQKIRKEYIDRYKRNDNIFSKRFDKLEVYKKLKKAPLFDELKPIDQQNISKTVKDRERREIQKIVDNEKQKRLNPYQDEQIKLKSQIDLFLQQQIDNEHFYNGTFPPKQF